MTSDQVADQIRNAGIRSIRNGISMILSAREVRLRVSYSNRDQDTITETALQAALESIDRSIHRKEP